MKSKRAVFLDKTYPERLAVNEQGRESRSVLNQVILVFGGYDRG
jgi:hypothetical protein